MIPSIAGRAHQNGTIIFSASTATIEKGGETIRASAGHTFRFIPRSWRWDFLICGISTSEWAILSALFTDGSYSIKVPTWSSGLLNQLHIPSPGPVLDSFRPTLAGQLILAGVSEDAII
jgi:hypothetical protein